MIRTIPIFDNGEFKDHIETDVDLQDGALMELITARDLTNDKDITILHVRDMEYGIIIPEHIAREIEDACDGPEKGGE